MGGVTTDRGPYDPPHYWSGRAWCIDRGRAIEAFIGWIGPQGAVAAVGSVALGRGCGVGMRCASFLIQKNTKE